LATVDGDLYAYDRKYGHERWHFKADHPMVDTRHFRATRPSVDGDRDPIDNYIWVVEPTRDGELYLWRSTETGAGLVKMTWTMKNMVEELSPFKDPANGVMYMGDKKTTMVTLDANTGTILEEFSSSDTYINNAHLESCSRPNAIADGDRECSDHKTITLGRTEYTVSIYRFDKSPVALLKYWEWGPNTYDNDLVQQNQITKDNCYITSQHDGRVYGFDFARLEKAQRTFTRKLDSPVARVFDVLRTWGSGDDSDLIVLPQPTIPADNDDDQRLRDAKVFVNQTEAGSWYALSGSRYPMIIDAPPARAHGLESWQMHDTDGALDERVLSKVLVGTHQLPDGRGSFRPDEPLPLLDAPVPEPVIPSSSSANTQVAPSATPSPEFSLEPVASKFSEPSIILNILTIIFFLVYLNKGFFMERIRRIRLPAFVQKVVPRSAKNVSERTVKTTPVILDQDLAVQPLSPVREPVEAKEAQEAKEAKEAVNGAVPAPITTDVDGTLAEEPDVKERSPTVTFADSSERLSQDSENGEGAQPDGAKKKKAHRGRRGGAKHKKKPAKDKLEPSLDDRVAEETVDEVVNKAKLLGGEPKLEPDIITISNEGDEVSGPVLKMGLLEVNEEQQLGTGSNGTVVFAGKWDGRAVAVKRMLVQFNDIASHETKLLRESDDHKNVIRYFAQQQRAAFLYIALELCQASLADIIQRPGQFRELARAGERDMPFVLYQITDGLNHLHSLRIVHRDLKPQNILVNMAKDGRPRLVVSDFGLCKKLEGGQSSFGATTAHAAGTSGWRAPELLLDDDAPGPHAMAMADPGSSMPSISGTSSGVVGADFMGPNSRRVTRAIDIFSLGLVFFYVLSKGSHPFDCGDRYMREVNIRKGSYSLDALEVLGDFAYEAKDLITSMISASPKQRPLTHAVMCHPFFWTAKKRLEFLCNVSDFFELEPRDPPSPALAELERHAPDVVRGDFLKQLPKEFVEGLGKQRKYTGTRMLDLLRALRNKKNHYDDMPESLKKQVGPLPDGYLGFWTRRFPNLLITCWNVVHEVGWGDMNRYSEYFEPARLQ